MFSLTLFFRYEHINEQEYRVQEQRNVGTWAEVLDFITTARDWGNVRNVGDGAMLNDVLVRISKEGEQGYKYAHCYAEGSGYFGPMNFS